MPRFRFSIRTLLVLVALTAIGCAVLTYCEPFKSRILMSRLRQAGVREVSFNYSVQNAAIDPYGIILTVDESTQLDQVRTLLPPPYKIEMHFAGRYPAGWTRQLRPYENLVAFYCFRDKITDDDVANLAGMNQLKKLHLPWTEVSDKSVPVLKAMPSLRWLDVHNSRVTSAGVEELEAKGIVVSTESPKEALDQCEEETAKQPSPADGK